MERNLPYKDFIGANSLDVFTHIVDLNPQMAYIGLQQYEYMPRVQSEQKTIWISRNKLLENQNNQELTQGLPDNIQVVVFSKVILDNSENAHIPMMDFDIKKSENGLGIVVNKLKDMGCAGWILESGDSYHYYGVKLLSEREWINFMGDCLLTSIVHNKDNIEQVADSRYIGHSLKRGGNCLRITSRAGKTFKPKVVAYIK